RANAASCEGSGETRNWYSRAPWETRERATSSRDSRTSKATTMALLAYPSRRARSAAPSKVVWCRYKKTSTSHWQSEVTPKVVSQPAISVSEGRGCPIVNPSVREAVGRDTGGTCDHTDECPHVFTGRAIQPAANLGVHESLRGFW